MRGAPWRRNYARSKRFASFFAGFSDERTMELTSHIGTGLSDRTVPDLVSLISYVCDTCICKENTQTIDSDPRLSKTACEEDREQLVSMLI